MDVSSSFGVIFESAEFLCAGVCGFFVVTHVRLRNSQNVAHSGLLMHFASFFSQNNEAWPEEAQEGEATHPEVSLQPHVPDGLEHLRPSWYGAWNLGLDFNHFGFSRPAWSRG